MKDLTWETRPLWGLHQLQKSLTNNLAATYVELKEISTLYLIIRTIYLGSLAFYIFSHEEK